jgi:hypothetical protein
MLVGRHNGSLGEVKSVRGGSGGRPAPAAGVDGPMLFSREMMMSASAMVAGVWHRGRIPGE